MTYINKLKLNISRFYLLTEHSNLKLFTIHKNVQIGKEDCFISLFYLYLPSVCVCLYLGMFHVKANCFSVLLNYLMYNCVFPHYLKQTTKMCPITPRLGVIKDNLLICYSFVLSEKWRIRYKGHLLYYDLYISAFSFSQFPVYVIFPIFPNVQSIFLNLFTFIVWSF